MIQEDFLIVCDSKSVIKKVDNAILLDYKAFPVGAMTLE